LDVLEETGQANETLLVLIGDHGVSLPEDGNNTPYDNPHVAAFHIPLVFSHPGLPAIKVDNGISVRGSYIAKFKEKLRHTGARQ
jgi:arylsulfatase A-like enzyme